MATIKALNSGIRERRALMEYWDRESRSLPFWRWLEIVEYDPTTDTFTLPDGTTITVEQINNPGAH